MSLNDRFARWNEKLNIAMRGRNGYDQLGMALVLVSIVCCLLDLRLRPFGSILGWIAIVAAAWRMLSRNIPARQAENARFLALIDKPARQIRRTRTKWQNRKTKAYVRCPHCHTEFALPKGKGKLRATCPHCGEKSVHTV